MSVFHGGRIVCRPLDESGDSLRLRNVNCVTSLHLDGLGAGALRHQSLCVWWDHLVIRGDEVQRLHGLALVRRKCSDIHEPGHFRIDTGFRDYDAP